VIYGVVDVLESTNEMTCNFKVESYAPSYSMLSCTLKEINLTAEDIVSKFPSIRIVLGKDQFLELSPTDYIYHCNVELEETICYTKLEKSE